MINNILNSFIGADLNVMVKLAEYSSLDVKSVNDSSKMTSIIGLLRKSLFVPILLYCKSKLNGKVDIYEGLLNIYIFSVIFILMFSGVLEIVVGRMTIYYFCVESILISFLFTVPSKIRYKIILFFIMFVYCALKFSWGLAAYPDEFIPYKWIL